MHLGLGGPAPRNHDNLLDLHTRGGAPPEGEEPHLHVVQPGFDGLEALLHRDVVHDHHAVRLPEELLGDAAVPAAATGIT